MQHIVASTQLTVMQRRHIYISGVFISSILVKKVGGAKTVLHFSNTDTAMTAHF